jgi:hypothetical protein
VWDGKSHGSRTEGVCQLETRWTPTSTGACTYTRQHCAKEMPAQTSHRYREQHLCDISCVYMRIIITLTHTCTQSCNTHTKIDILICIQAHHTHHHRFHTQKHPPTQKHPHPIPHPTHPPTHPHKCTTQIRVLANTQARNTCPKIGFCTSHPRRCY